MWHESVSSIGESIYLAIGLGQTKSLHRSSRKRPKDTVQLSNVEHIALRSNSIASYSPGRFFMGKTEKFFIEQVDGLIPERKQAFAKQLVLTTYASLFLLVEVVSL